MDRSERFRRFIDHMEERDAAVSIETGLELLSMVMNAIEDEFSGVDYDPTKWRSDGRMYPPHADYERESEHPEVRVFRTRGHWVRIASNGAIRIITVVGKRVVLDKPGANGALSPY